MPLGPFDWYFDFISPFSYTHWRALRRNHAEIALNPNPVLLAAILGHSGQLGPAELRGKRTVADPAVKAAAQRKAART